MRRLGLIAASAMLAGLASLSGCGQGAKGSCPAGGNCGGDPSGAWQAVEGCQFHPLRPGQPLDVADFMTTTPPRPPMITPPQPNPVVLQQTTSGDWCSTLVVKGSGDPTPDPATMVAPGDTKVANVNLWHDAPTIDLTKPAGSTVTNSTIKFFKDDHSYITSFAFSTPSSTHFAPICLVANGGNPSCTDLGAALGIFYKAQMATVPDTFNQFSCAAASDGGCDCNYVYNLLVSDTGTWKVEADGHTITQQSAIYLFNGFQVPSQAPGAVFQSDFCSSGGQLELSGSHGSSLAGIQGLRSLVFAAIAP